MNQILSKYREPPACPTILKADTIELALFLLCLHLKACSAYRSPRFFRNHSASIRHPFPLLFYGQMKRELDWRSYLTIYGLILLVRICKIRDAAAES